MELIVEKKNVFGVDRVYPKCDKALLLLKLMPKEQKTFTDHDIKILKELNYKLKTESEAV